MIKWIKAFFLMHNHIGAVSDILLLNKRMYSALCILDLIHEDQTKLIAKLASEYLDEFDHIGAVSDILRIQHERIDLLNKRMYSIYEDQTKLIANIKAKNT